MGKPVFNPYGMDPGFRSTYDPYNEEQKMLFCPKCGAEVSDGEIKCPVCGKEISPDRWSMEEEAREKKRKIKKAVFVINATAVTLSIFLFLMRTPV